MQLDRTRTETLEQSRVGILVTFLNTFPPPSRSSVFCDDEQLERAIRRPSC